MKEMIIGLGGDYYYITVSEKAIERLPQEYQKRDSFFNTVTLYENECIDTRVIALAKEMKEEFYNHSERDGFKIIAWDETKVIPVFMVTEYGSGWDEEELYFVSIEDADEWEIEQGFIHTYCCEEDLLRNEYPYDFIDYDATEVLVVKNHDEYENNSLNQEPEEPDAIPIKKRYVLSINPIDYLAMSQGNSWASCHNIDNK